MTDLQAHTLTADELVDHLNSYPGSHHAERKSSATVTVMLNRPSTNIPQRVIGVGWSLYLISEQGRRLVFIEDACKDAEYHAEMNQQEAHHHLERNGQSAEGAYE